MLRSLLIIALVFGPVSAQADILIETQRFFGLGGGEPNYLEDEQTQREGSIDQAPFSPADSDLGVQEILDQPDDRAPVVFNFNASVLRTDTAPSGNPTTDEDSWVFTTSASLSWMPKLVGGWFGDFGFQQGMIRYDRTNAVDFENMLFRAGVYKIFPDLDDTVFLIRYEYQRLTSTSLVSGDYHAERVRAGLQKTLWDASRKKLFGGISATYEWDVLPIISERTELSVSLTYTQALSEKWSFVGSALVSRFAYSEGGRDDWRMAVSADLIYRMSSHVDARLSVVFDKNDSNTGGRANEYEAWSGGLGAGIQVLF